MVENAKRPGVRASVAVTTLSRYSMLLISLGSTMALARLLTPTEIGIFSMAIVFANLAHSLRTFGVGQYIIQEQDLTQDRLRTAFGITLAIAWCMAILLLVCAPWVARFYGEPGVADILRVLAINFALIPVSSVILSRMNRDMRFSTLFRISVSSEFLRASTAVALAWAGFGYMSMAWSAVVGVISTVVLARVLGGGEFVLRPGFREWRRVLSFGGRATLATVAFDLQRGAPDIIIGRYMNAASVGFFGKALGVVRLFDQAVLSAVGPAVLPHMAARHRAGETLTAFYSHGLRLVTALAWPFYTFIAVMTLPVIRLLFGDQWDAAAPVARILVIYAGINVLFAFAGSALLAVGMVHLVARLRLVTLGATVLALVLAVEHGLETIAYAMVFPALVGLLYSYRLMRSAIGLKLSAYLDATIPGLVIAAATAALPVFYLWSNAAAEQPHWQVLLVGAAGAGAGWLIGVITLRHAVWHEMTTLLSQARARIRPARG